MRIEFQRSGGFAPPAMKRSLTIDTNDLSDADAAHLRALVSAALAAPAPTGEPRPDAYYYKITIHDDPGEPRVLRSSDSSMDDAVRPLVDWLRKRAQPTAAPGTATP